MAKKKPSRKAKQSGSSGPKADNVSNGLTFDIRAIEGTMRQLVAGLSEGESEVEAAQEIVDEAYEEADPRRQVVLARKALKVSPDCADAYVLLAEHASTLPEALKLFEQGVAAGERALGKQGFKEYAGHFWGFLPTRPYMRARAGLADCLWEVGERETATEHCREMLRLNPNDNQGIRYRLSSMLLDLEKHDELERLLEEYRDDGSAEWAYNRALLAFRREGDSASARKALRAAKKVNVHVPDYLARIKRMPREAPDYITFGGEDEAVGYAGEFLPAWKDTPGATAWLRKTLKLSPAAAPPKQRESWRKLCAVLTRLPQGEDEMWELDVRHVAQPDSGAVSHWMLVALNTTAEQVVHFDFNEHRPKETDVWRFLTAAIREPQEGEPHRPAIICLSRKSWFHAWRAKLKEIGVECQLRDSLEQLDWWYQMTMPQLENLQRAAHAARPTDVDWSKVGSLSQRPEETWQAVVEQLPIWLPNDGEPKRPWVSLVIDVHSEAILATGIETGEGGEDMLLKGVWQALCAPAVGEAHRPGAIQVASDQKRESLAPHLESLGIRCVTSPDLELVRHLIGELAIQLGGGQQRKALIHTPGVTLAQIGNLFEAAAVFYRARPWRQIPGDHVIRVACEQFSSGPWYAVVMGQSGLEQGLALYEDAEFLHALFSGKLSAEESGRRTSALSMTYGEAFDVAAEDLDAAEQHGWMIAGPEAYPCVLRVNPGMAVRTPLKWELELLEGCLRTFPDFLGQRLSKAVVPMTVSGESMTFHLERLEDVG